MNDITRLEIDRYAPVLQLTRHTGLIIAWHQQYLSFRGSPVKLNSKLKSITIKNMLFGWWSPVSVLLNPIVTITNFVSFHEYKKQYEEMLRSPSLYVIHAKEKEVKAELKAKKNAKRGVKIILVLSAVFVILIIFVMIKDRTR